MTPQEAQAAIETLRESTSPEIRVLANALLALIEGSKAAAQEADAMAADLHHSIASLTLAVPPDTEAN